MPPILNENFALAENIFRQNTLLASLREREADLLRPLLKKVQVEQGRVLAEIGSAISRVYFPVSGLLNVFALTLDGQAVRTATVGRDGAIGINFDAGRATGRVVAQLTSILLSIGVPQFRDIVETSLQFRRIYEQTLESQLEQARSAAICNLLHSAEQRVCRLLLETSDRTSSDEVTLTHELLSDLVGVQRSFVTAIAASLRRKGAIDYGRGTITISNRRILKQFTCECYDRSSNPSRTTS